MCPGIGSPLGWRDGSATSNGNDCSRWICWVLVGLVRQFVGPDLLTILTRFWRIPYWGFIMCRLQNILIPPSYPQIRLPSQLCSLSYQSWTNKILCLILCHQGDGRKHEDYLWDPQIWSNMPNSWTSYCKRTHLWSHPRTGFYSSSCPCSLLCIHSPGSLPHYGLYYYWMVLRIEETIFVVLGSPLFVLLVNFLMSNTRNPTFLLVSAEL